MNLRQTALRTERGAARVHNVAGCGWATVLLLVPGIVGVAAFIGLFFGESSTAGLTLLMLPWPAALVGLYHAAGDRAPWAKGCSIWLVGSLLFGLELLLGGWAVLNDHGGLYLFVALLATVAGLWGAYRLTHD